jgi:hypothetical protein
LRESGTPVRMPEAEYARASRGRDRLVGVKVCRTGAAGLVGLAAWLSALVVRKRSRAAVRSALRRGGVELPLTCIGLAGSEPKSKSNWIGLSRMSR